MLEEPKRCRVGVPHPLVAQRLGNVPQGLGRHRTLPPGPGAHVRPGSRRLRGSLAATQMWWPTALAGAGSLQRLPRTMCDAARAYRLTGPSAPVEAVAQAATAARPRGQPARKTLQLRARCGAAAGVLKGACAARSCMRHGRLVDRGCGLWAPRPFQSHLLAVTSAQRRASTGSRSRPSSTWAVVYEKSGRPPRMLRFGTHLQPRSMHTHTRTHREKPVQLAGSATGCASHPTFSSSRIPSLCSLPSGAPIRCPLASLKRLHHVQQESSE